MDRGVKVFLFVFVGAVLIGLGLVGSCVLTGLIRARKASRRTRCANNLRQIGMASQLYLNDHKVFPFAGDDADGYEHIQLLFDGGYLHDPVAAICNASSDVPATIDVSGKCTLGPENCSYLWAKEPRNDSDPADLPLAADAHETKGPKGSVHPGGRMVLFNRFRVKWIPEEEFQEKIQPHLTTE